MICSNSISASFGGLSECLGNLPATFSGSLGNIFGEVGGSFEGVTGGSADFCYDLSGK